MKKYKIIKVQTSKQLENEMNELTDYSLHTLKVIQATPVDLIYIAVMVLDNVH